MPTLINRSDVPPWWNGEVSTIQSVVQQVQWKHRFSACTHRTKLCASHLCGDSSSTHVNFLLQACQPEGPLDQTVNLGAVYYFIAEAPSVKFSGFCSLRLHRFWHFAQQAGLTIGKFSGSICSHHMALFIQVQRKSGLFKYIGSVEWQPVRAWALKIPICSS